MDNYPDGFGKYGQYANIYKSIFEEPDEEGCESDFEEEEE